MVSYESESEGWSIRQEGEDLIIGGPGHLEIVVNRFDQTKIQHNEPLSPESVGDSPQIDWLYTLDEAIALHLVSTKGPDGDPVHRLHLGAEGTKGCWQVSWHLPDSFAAILYQLEAVSGGG